MKKVTKDSVPKQSKKVVKPVGWIEELKNSKITSESTAILTIEEQGSFKTRKSNAGTKEQKELMKKSWCYSKTKKGEWQSSDGEKWFPLKPGTKPRNWYEGPKTYNEPEYHECIRRIVLNSDSVQFYTSMESFPGRTKKERAEWEAMAKYERLIKHAETTACPGKLLSIKIVE